MASGTISPRTNKLVNVIVCVGAAVVIFGAWAKILHKPFADIMLTVGLLTEALIFLVYAMLPPPDSGHVAKPGEGHSSTKSLEQMLQEANITQETLGKLSGGFQKLTGTVEKLGELTDVVKSTSDFGAKTKEASAALSGITASAGHATSSLDSFKAGAETNKQFHTQVQTLTKNLSSLNTIYELELQESTNHLKALNQFYGKLAQASAAMNSSADDAIKAKEQIAVLANNLGKLNQVYGNMLTAMQGRA